jgi:hypothetical protein
MRNAKIIYLEGALATARAELDAACRALNMGAMTPKAITLKEEAERRVDKIEALLRAETEAAVGQTSASLGPDSVVKLLSAGEYTALCDAANRLGRAWKSQLYQEHGRGGNYGRLGIPAAYHTLIHSAISRIGIKLNDLVATQTTTEPEPKP